MEQKRDKRGFCIAGVIFHDMHRIYRSRPHGSKQYTRHTVDNRLRTCAPAYSFWISWILPYWQLFLTSSVCIWLLRKDLSCDISEKKIYDWMYWLKIIIEAYIAEVFSDESGFFFSNVYAVTMVPFFTAITATIHRIFKF